MTLQLTYLCGKDKQGEKVPEHFSECCAAFAYRDDEDRYRIHNATKARSHTRVLSRDRDLYTQTVQHF